jgi:hypothetical protein
MYYSTCKMFQKLYSGVRKVTGVHDQMSEDDVGRTCRMCEITGEIVV